MAKIIFQEHEYNIDDSLLYMMIVGMRNDIAGELLFKCISGTTDTLCDIRLKQFVNIMRDVLKDSKNYDVLVELIKCPKLEKRAFIQHHRKDLSQHFDIEMMLSVR